MLSDELKSELLKIGNTIRGLSLDAIQRANSGHPGLPLGCADIGSYLYGVALRYNPHNPSWMNRDRFVLSAGHGSMLLYSCLFLSGYGLTIEDLKQFRQLHSRTPGHPEVHVTPGVEATTGPLGQGMGNAIGMALAGKCLAARFNTAQDSLFDYKVFCLCSDGDLMEGVSHEVCSFAGHLKLDNVICLYDNNGISLDGPTADSLSDDAKLRFEAYGWDVFHISGYDLDALDAIISKARTQQMRPIMIICDTVIGKGSPHKEGSHEAHGAPFGPEETLETKRALGIPVEEFFVPPSVEKFFRERLLEGEGLETAWNRRLQAWENREPEKATQLKNMLEGRIPSNLEQTLRAIPLPDSVAGRAMSGTVLQTLADQLPQLIGGSADLSGSDRTFLKKYGVIAPGQFDGRNIKFGVREFGMATICNGLTLNGGFLPYCGTFLTFSDYMRNAIRLAALSHDHVIYQFTHDSIFLGEDGPTHQAIEQLASLRAMPNLQVIRPGDAHEVVGAWLAALAYEGPTAIILTRQNLPTLPACDRSFADGVGRGAYILLDAKDKELDFTLFATGSELHLAVDVARELERRGKAVRVVSMPCWELFNRQPKEYRERIIGGNLGQRVSIEAGSELGWERYIGRDGLAIGMESFGASAPAEVLAHEFGFTVDAILERLL
ncbi:MAG: transketolase [Chlamydiia bacterium]